MANFKLETMNPSRLANKAEYISKHFDEPQFRGILRDAKADWLQKGNTFSIERVKHELLCDVHYLNEKEVSQAVATYILSHGEEMLQKDRASSRRYRLRKKHKIAYDNVSKGMSPAVYRGRIVWIPIQFPNDPCRNRVEQGYFPTVKNNEIAWELAPQK